MYQIGRPASKCKWGMDSFKRNVLIHFRCRWLSLYFLHLSVQSVISIWFLSQLLRSISQFIQTQFQLCNIFDFHFNWFMNIEANDHQIELFYGEEWINRKGVDWSYRLFCSGGVCVAKQTYSLCMFGVYYEIEECWHRIYIYWSAQFISTHVTGCYSNFFFLIIFS